MNKTAVLFSCFSDILLLFFVSLLFIPFVYGHLNAYFHVQLIACFVRSFSAKQFFVFSVRMVAKKKVKRRIKERKVKLAHRINLTKSIMFLFFYISPSKQTSNEFSLWKNFPFFFNFFFSFDSFFH